VPETSPTVRIHAPDPLLADMLAGALRDAGIPVGTGDPGVVLVDLGPDGADPLPAAAAPVLALAADPEAAAQALAAGAAGVLARTLDGARIAAALRVVALGLVVLEPGFQPAAPTPLPPEASPLSPREQDVLELLAEGLSNKEIGHRLFVSANTVRFHVGAILEKLDAASRTEAVVTGARLGLLDL
jgi:DNA-binding NarL/FixJ family response regulator